MYEYVSRPEYAPIRKELEEIIKRTQIEMRKNYSLTFQISPDRQRKKASRYQNPRRK